MSITLTGFTTNAAIANTQTAQPFGSLTVSDSVADDQVSAAISFTAANGTLSGAGLSQAGVTGGVATYTLAATSAANLQSELRALSFTPDAAQAGAVTTNFTLDVSGVSTVPTDILSNGIRNPSAVATDASGDLFDLNGAANAVEEFSAAGALVRTLKTGISNPSAIATDASGDLFVANVGADDVVEFTASGAPLRILTNGVHQPTSVATDGSGDVFVGNWGAPSLEFSASGSLLNTFGDDTATSLATDAAGDVFANAGLNSVQEYSASGQFLRTLSSGLTDAVNLATDGSGDVFVTDPGNADVREFSPTGGLVQTLSSGIDDPFSVAADASGDIYVASYGDDTVEEFSASGSLLRTLSSGVSLRVSSVIGNLLATDAAGDVFVANAGDDTVAEFSAPSVAQDSTTQVTAAPPAAAPTITGAIPAWTTTFETPISPFAGVTVDDSNVGAYETLTIALSGAGGVLAGAGLTDAGAGVFTLTGSASAVTSELDALTFTPAAGAPGSSASTTLALSDVSSAGGAPAATASILVVDADSALALAVGGFQDSAITDAQTTHPFATTTISDSALDDLPSATISFAAASGTLSGAGLSQASVANGVSTYTLAPAAPASLQSELQALVFTPTVGAVPPSQTATTDFTLAVNSGSGPIQTFTSAVSLAVVTDQAGDVFMTGFDDVQEFSKSGALLNTLSSGMKYPDALATDASGDLFVANLHGDDVQEFSASGALLQTLTNGVQSPVYLATDASRDVFVAGYNNVEEFSASGSLLLSLAITDPLSIATDASGDFFVANGHTGVVQEYSAAGQSIQNLGSGAVSIATDASGDVYVANFRGSAVQEFDPYGDLVQTLSSGVDHPTSVAVDASSDAFVANYGDFSGANREKGSVEEFSPSGALLRTLGQGASLSNQIGGPKLAVDGYGDVFATGYEGGLDSVSEFAPAATSVSSATKVTVSPAERWTGGTGNWSVASDWSLGEPTASSDVVIQGASSRVVLTAPATVASVTLGQSASLGVSAGLSVTNALNVAGATLRISGGVVQVGAGGAVSGSIVGAGALALDGGNTTFSTGAALSSSAWSLGAGATATLNVQISYSGRFSAGSGAELALNGAGLTLKGATTLAGVTVTSANTRRWLSLFGASAVSGLTIAGDALVYNSGSATQSGGSITIGDAVASNPAELFNAASGAWNIADDSGVALGADAASLLYNAGLLAKTGGTGTSTIAASVVDVGSVSVASGTLAFGGPSNSFSGAISGAGAVQFSGGVTTLKSGASLSVASLNETGAGTRLMVAQNLGYAGAFTQGAGAALLVGAGDMLTLSGTDIVSGAVGGAGSLALTGSATFTPGASLSVARLNVSGAQTTMTVGESLSYSGAFSAGAGASIALTGGALSLRGATTLAGATVTSAGLHQLYLFGATAVQGLTVGGQAVLANSGVVTQSGGSITIGDGVAADKAMLYNTAAGVWNIADDSGVARGADAASLVYNTGLFEKTDGRQTSVVAAAVVNTGEISAQSGTLELAATVSGTGAMQASGGATLKLDGVVAATQSLSYGADGGEIFLNDLGASQLFHGSIQGWGTGDSLDLGTAFGADARYNFNENASDTGGTLTVSSGHGASASIAFGGLGGAMVTSANFAESYSASGGVLLAYHPGVQQAS